MLSGSFRWKRKLNGIRSAHRTASTMQAVRQPLFSITDCSTGISTTEKMPTPAKAMPSAKPRLRTNQLGRNIEWPI